MVDFDFLTLFSKSYWKFDSQIWTIFSILNKQNHFW